jgi:hypothetical protein
LIGGHDTQLFPLDADEANGADADLLVNPQASVLRRMAVADTLSLLFLVIKRVQKA